MIESVHRVVIEAGENAMDFETNYTELCTAMNTYWDVTQVFGEFLDFRYSDEDRKLTIVVDNITNYEYAKDVENQIYRRLTEILNASKRRYLYRNDGRR